MVLNRMSEVFETREVVSISVQLSCQEAGKQEKPKRVVSARLGIRDDGPNVACCGSRLHELCWNITLT